MFRPCSPPKKHNAERCLNKKQRAVFSCPCRTTGCKTTKRSSDKGFVLLLQKCKLAFLVEICCTSGSWLCCGFNWINEKRFMSSEDSESQPFYVGRIPKALSDELHCHQRHVELSLTWILFYTCVSLSSNTVFTNELN